MLYGFPIGSLVGKSVCDCIDVFKEWREINGLHELQLLMLALLDKEAEMPGERALPRCCCLQMRRC